MKLKVETFGVTAGQGKEIRYISDANRNELLGTVSKEYGDNGLWCVYVYRGADIHDRDRCHGSYAAAMAFARKHFGGG